MANRTSTPENHQQLIVRLEDELAMYQEQNPQILEALRIFSDANKTFEAALDALNSARLEVSNSSYGRLH